MPTGCIAELVPPRQRKAYTDGQTDSMFDCLIAYKLRGRPDDHQPALSTAELNRLFGHAHKAEHDPTYDQKAVFGKSSAGSL